MHNCAFIYIDYCEVNFLLAANFNILPNINTFVVVINIVIQREQNQRLEMHR